MTSTLIDALRIRLHNIAYTKIGIDVFTHTRKKEYLKHRQSIMYLLYKRKDHLNISLSDVGYICSSEDSRFDHSSVRHNYKLVESELDMYMDRKINVEFWKRALDVLFNNYYNNLIDISNFLNRIENEVEITERERELISIIRTALI